MGSHGRDVIEQSWLDDFFYQLAKKQLRNENVFRFLKKNKKNQRIDAIKLKLIATTATNKNIDWLTMSN